MRVAIAQDAPVFLDADASCQRAIAWMEEAAKADARLVAFGETWLPGYPFWITQTDGARFNDERQKRAYAQYLDAAVEAEGPELRRLEEAARDLKLGLVMGLVERGRGSASGSVYCSLAFIHPERGCAPLHRKLVPTFEERLAWCPGDGHGLRVHELDGVRISALNCWENWMPQARHALYAQGTQVHVAIWPGSRRLTQDITRFVALEGRVFCVSASGILAREDLPGDFELVDAVEDGVYYEGASAIAGPDGQWLVPPENERRELIVADLDVSRVGQERQNFDPTGHYARPDVFRVEVDRTRRVATHFVEN
jgi:nitrilase